MNVKDMNCELGLIGGGNMAEAILRAAIEHQIIPRERLIVSDPVESRRVALAELGLHVTGSNAEVVMRSRQMVLAIKPQTLPSISEDLKAVDPAHQIVMSIMAGVRSESIEKALGKNARVVRVMPNTPLLVGCGMAAVSLGAHAKKGDELLAMQLFGAAGKAIVVDESLMDAVTAVSGSGPAYVFYLAEAMTQAGESLGLTAEHAALLTKQTILGAAKLMAESDDEPAELRRKVTSPGGTTQAAIEQMESSQVRAKVIEAMKKAAEKSKELGG